MPRYLVEDMSCEHCIATVTKAVEKADPQARLDIDLTTKVVAIDSSIEEERLQETLRSAGYEPRSLD